MRWPGRRVTVYAYARPTDMRKGFDGLSALVLQGLQRDPLSGDVFIFVSRDRMRAT
jgi:transposase